MRPWSIFFGVLSLVIVITLMLPAAFGLQNFTQWGGMYTNSWCGVWMYADNPFLTQNADTPKQWMTAGLGDGTRIVWYGDQHNQLTCALWAKTRCGQRTGSGWVVTWAVPMFKEQAYLGQGNACDLRSPTSFEWFHHAS